MNGQGTLENPYIIETPDDYKDILSSNTNVNHYVLGNDIDFTGYELSGFNPSRNLSGSLDGKGFTVKNATGIGAGNIGMVPNLQAGAVLKNIRYENIHLSTSSTATNRVCALVGTVTSATIENLEVVNSSFHAGATALTASVIRTLTGSFAVKNIKMIDVAVKGGATYTGFFGTINTFVGGYSLSDCVFTGSFSGYATGIKSDALFGHEPDKSLFFYKVYVLDKNLPPFDRSKGCATYVTDAQLKEPSQIPLGDAWSHSDGQYPNLKLFSGDIGNQVVARKTITVKKATLSRKTGKHKTQFRSVTAKGATVKTRSLQYSTRAFISAKKVTFTVKTMKIKSMRVTSHFDLGKVTTNQKLLRRVLMSIVIDLGRVTVHSNVVYPSSGNVPVYAYTSIITGRSNAECRVTQSSIYRIL